MKRFLAIVISVILVSGCAPTWSSYCSELPDINHLSANEKVRTISSLSDEKVLDLVACTLSTSHPPHLDFPDELITGRGRPMAASLVNRLKRQDEGFISGAYADYLVEILSNDSQALPSYEKSEIQDLCIQAGGVTCREIK